MLNCAERSISKLRPWLGAGSPGIGIVLGDVVAVPQRQRELLAQDRQRFAEDGAEPRVARRVHPRLERHMVGQVRHARRLGGHPGRALRGLDPASLASLSGSVSGVRNGDDGVATSRSTPAFMSQNGLTGCFTETRRRPVRLVVARPDGCGVADVARRRRLQLRRRRVRPVERDGQRTPVDVFRQRFVSDAEASGAGFRCRAFGCLVVGCRAPSFCGPRGLLRLARSGPDAIARSAAAARRAAAVGWIRMNFM